MLRDVDKGLFDVILIHKYDRVARNLGEHVSLEKRLKDRKVELIAVAQDFGSTAEAKIMRTLMWSLSEYYLDNLSSEVKKGHRETALKALHNGGTAPFGYDVVNQRYVVNELEAGYVRKLFDAAVNREGYTAILAEMEAAGITGKRGKPIKYTQVYEMLRNEKYTGTYNLYAPRGGAPGRPEEQAQRDTDRKRPAADHQQGAVYGGTADHDGEEADWEEGRVFVQRPCILPVRGQDARSTDHQEGTRVFPLLLLQEVRGPCGAYGRGRQGGCGLPSQAAFPGESGQDRRRPPPVSGRGEGPDGGV